jgi:hypothetical protein
MTPPLRNPAAAAWYALLVMLASAPAGAQPVPVELRHVNGDANAWQLVRDGKPYFINGVGGQDSLELLVDCGGNSIRTWGADNLGAKLDEAKRLGLTVTVGIWLGHERHGFNYNDAKQVAEQHERARAAIEKYKSHPAVLMWGIGNEMEGFGDGGNEKIWSAVEAIAKTAKQLDPNHPTMTVVAEIGGQRVPAIHKHCPSIDVIGINSYGGGPTVARRYREAGGKKPFVLTEFGPNGFWESGKTSWGAPLEPTSTAKAASYRKTYEGSILAEREKLCLGGYAFLWGQKQEATPTWFGMLLKDGSRTEAVDAMRQLWTGKPPPNRCPQITSLKLTGEDQQPPGGRVSAALASTDSDGDELKVTWELREEPAEPTAGGDAQKTPPTHPDAIQRGDQRGVEVRLPQQPGAYRLFAFVHDPHGGAAVANVPILVKPQ